MTGGIYLWKDGREVPDTMNVSMEQPEELLFSWDSGFGNSALGVSEDILGTDGTISKNAQIRYAPQKINRPQGSEMQGRHHRVAARPHAELRRFDPRRQAHQLPVRGRLPGVHRLPYGRGQLSARPGDAVGCGEGRDHLAKGRDLLAKHARHLRASDLHPLYTGLLPDRLSIAGSLPGGW